MFGHPEIAHVHGHEDIGWGVRAFTLQALE
jgi:hypothetical protein